MKIMNKFWMRINFLRKNRGLLNKKFKFIPKSSDHSFKALRSDKAAQSTYSADPANN